jgi:hypothetical protein
MSKLIYKQSGDFGGMIKDTRGREWIEAIACVVVLGVLGYIGIVFASLDYGVSHYAGDEVHCEYSNEIIK